VDVHLDRDVPSPHAPHGGLEQFASLVLSRTTATLRRPAGPSGVDSRSRTGPEHVGTL